MFTFLQTATITLTITIAFAASSNILASFIYLFNELVVNSSTVHHFHVKMCACVCVCKCKYCCALCTHVLIKCR